MAARAPDDRLIQRKAEGAPPAILAASRTGEDRAMHHVPAAGRPTVLVAEPQALPGLWLEDVLADAGWGVSGPFGTCLDAAETLERTRPDCAVLSVDMDQGPGFPLACALRRRRIPFILVTGSAPIPRAFADAPVLDRPFTERDVLQAVTACVADDRRRADPAPCPMHARIAAGEPVALDQCPAACGA
jgi:DNA-binding NtrC family response regulator